MSLPAHDNWASKTAAIQKIGLPKLRESENFGDWNLLTIPFAAVMGFPVLWIAAVLVSRCFIITRISVHDVPEPSATQPAESACRLALARLFVVSPPHLIARVVVLKIVADDTV